MTFNLHSQAAACAGKYLICEEKTTPPAGLHIIYNIANQPGFRPINIQYKFERFK
jgi:hypothetical protein